MKVSLRQNAVWTLCTALALFLAGFTLSISAVILHFSGNAVFPVECAVVFGSAVREGNKAGPGIYRRVETAVHLLKEGSVQRLFFTGGVGEGNSSSEAQVMRDEAIEMGADPKVISLEENASSTWQNIYFVRPQIMNCESVVGISDRYHLARIRLTSLLLDVPMQVYPAERKAGFAFEAVAVPREALGILAYFLRNLCKTPFVTPGRVTLSSLSRSEGVSKGGHDRATQGDTFCRTSLTIAE